MAQTEAVSLFSSYLKQYGFYGENHPKGTLVMIGGAEDKTGKREILRYIRRKVGKGKLVVCTASSGEAQEQWRRYERCFRELGVRRIEHLDLRDRQDASDEEVEEILEGASGVFLGGGGQDVGLSKIEGTKVKRGIRQAYINGAVVAGTSAGASLLSELMPCGDEVMGGLVLLRRTIVDQHYTQRGREERLAEAVCDHPSFLGIGIDENTALAMNGGWEVIGEGSVHLIGVEDVERFVEGRVGSLKEIGRRLRNI